jgi:hypothetical protein
MLVEEAALEHAVAALLDRERLVVEGAGAAPLAALLGNAARFRGRRVGLVLSGGNIDARLLASILQRELVRAGRLVRLRIEITDLPGALAKVTGAIGERGGNIVEIYHQRLFYDVPVKLAEVDAVVETRNPAHVGEIIAALAAAGFSTRTWHPASRAVRASRAWLSAGVQTWTTSAALAARHSSSEANGRARGNERRSAAAASAEGSTIAATSTPARAA